MRRSLILVAALLVVVVVVDTTRPYAFVASSSCSPARPTTAAIFHDSPQRATAAGGSSSATTSQRAATPMTMGDLEQPQQQTNNNPQMFPHSNKPPPHLALITMRCSCDSDDHTQAALQGLQQAVSTRNVDLVSVRVNVPHNDKNVAPVQERLTRIVQQLVAWSSTNDNKFRVVVSSDWIEPGLRAGAHGVHFKETHRDRIPAARRLFGELSSSSSSSTSSRMLVGTSTHTVASALDAVQQYQPDYFFAGTCFETESHPEKTGDDLEGPARPAEVVQALDQYYLQLGRQQRQRPKVLAIGGLDASNCRDQVTTGRFVPDAKADGIATISAVLKNAHPDRAVQDICNNMRRQQDAE